MSLWSGNHCDNPVRLFVSCHYDHLCYKRNQVSPHCLQPNLCSFLQFKDKVNLNPCCQIGRCTDKEAIWHVRHPPFKAVGSDVWEVGRSSSKLESIRLALWLKCAVTSIHPALGSQLNNTKDKLFYSRPMHVSVEQFHSPKVGREACVLQVQLKSAQCDRKTNAYLLYLFFICLDLITESFIGMFSVLVWGLWHRWLMLTWKCAETCFTLQLLNCASPWSPSDISSCILGYKLCTCYQTTLGIIWR